MRAEYCHKQELACLPFYRLVTSIGLRYYFRYSCGTLNRYSHCNRHTSTVTFTRERLTIRIGILHLNYPLST